MKLVASKNGMFLQEHVQCSCLPVFDFTKGNDIGLPFDFCTRSQLKILGIELSDEQKQEMIKGFVRLKGYRGYSALYSFKEIRTFF